MWTACLLAKQGIIDPTLFVEVVHRHLASRPPIGRVALRERLISLSQVVDVLKQQAETGEPFGKIAQGRGYLSQQELAHLLLRQLEEATPVDDLLIELSGLTRDELEHEKKRLRGEFAEHIPTDGSSIEGEAPMPELAGLSEKP